MKSWTPGVNRSWRHHRNWFGYCKAFSCGSHCVGKLLRFIQGRKSRSKCSCSLVMHHYDPSSDRKLHGVLLGWFSLQEEGSGLVEHPRVLLYGLVSIVTVCHLDDFAATVYGLAKDSPGHGWILGCDGGFHWFSLFPVLHYARHKPVRVQGVASMKPIARTRNWTINLAWFPTPAGKETLSYIESHKTFATLLIALISLGLFSANRAICQGLTTDKVLSLYACSKDMRKTRKELHS